MRASYLAAVLKIIDLVETGIFILRKKNNQITALHLYHHVTTMIVAVISARYISTGMAVFVPILNCSVHVIMYTYYFLSNLDGPIKQMVFPLKRYITIIQMVIYYNKFYCQINDFLCTKICILYSSHIIPPGSIHHTGCPRQYIPSTKLPSSKTTWLYGDAKYIS